MMGTAYEQDVNC